MLLGYFILILQRLIMLINEHIDFVSSHICTDKSGKHIKREPYL